MRVRHPAGRILHWYKQAAMEARTGQEAAAMEKGHARRQ